MGMYSLHTSGMLSMANPSECVIAMFKRAYHNMTNKTEEEEISTLYKVINSMNKVSTHKA